MNAAADAAILATRSPAAQPFRMTERSKQDKRAKERRRLSAALRENLKRRKAQARGRSTAEAVERSGKPHDSAGIAEDK